MSWFRVDDKSAFHRKVLKAGNEAWGAICRAGAVSSGEGTDGRVSLETMLAIAPMRVWKKGIDAGLVEKIDEATYQLHDYLQWNESAAEIELKAAARRKKSENAAQARWGARGRIRGGSAPAVPDPSLNDAPGNAPSMPGALPQAHTSGCPDPIQSISSLKGAAEDLTGRSPPGPEPAAAAPSLNHVLERELARHPITRPIARPNWVSSLLGSASVSRPLCAADIEEGVEWAVSQLLLDAAPGEGVGLTQRAIADRVKSGLLGAPKKRRSEAQRQQHDEPVEPEPPRRHIPMPKPLGAE